MIKIIDKIFGTKLYLKFLKHKTDILMKNLKYEECSDILSEVFSRYEELDDSFYIKASCCYRNLQEYSKAFEILKRVKNNYENADFLAEMGRLHIARESVKGVDYLEKSFDISKDKFKARELAEAYLQFDFKEKAYEFYLQVYSIFPEDIDIVREITRLSYFLKKFDKCEEFLDVYELLKGIDKNFILEFRGLLAEAKGDLNGAVVFYEKLYSTNPENEIAFEHLFFIYETTSNYKKLKNILEIQEKIKKDDLNLKYRLGCVLFELGELRKARTYFEILIENNFFEKAFIKKYISILMDFREYIKTEKLCLNLIDSQVFTRRELASTLSNLYFKMGKLNLFLKYSEYDDNKEKYENIMHKIRNIDKELVFCFVYINKGKLEAHLKCEFITLDKIETEDMEIFSNFFAGKENYIIIIPERKAEEKLYIQNSDYFELEKVLKNIPGINKKIDGIQDMEDVFFNLINYFKNNEKTFHAFVHMAKECDKEFFYFLKRFLNIKLGIFSIDEYLSSFKINLPQYDKKELPAPEKNKDYNVIDSSVSWIEENKINDFVHYISFIVNNFTSKFLLITARNENNQKITEVYGEYENITIFKGDYICLYRFRELFKIKEQLLSDTLFWLSRTQTGSMNEVEINEEVKNYMKACDKNCLQLECDYYENCFFQHMKKNIFSNRIIITDITQLDFFEEKVENAIFFSSPALIPSLFKEPAIELKKLQMFLKNLELYFEINLKNNTQAFNFYRNLKESIIKIERLSQRIIELSGVKHGSEVFPCKYLFKAVEEFITYFKRLYAYTDYLHENLYNVESFLNKSRLHLVELNFYRNNVKKYSKIIKKVVENYDNVWIEFFPDNTVFYDVDYIPFSFLKKKIYLNNYAGLNKSFSLFRDLLQIKKYTLNYCLENANEEVLSEDRLLNYIIFSKAHPSADIYLDYYYYMFNLIEENNSAGGVLKEVIEEREYRDFFRTLRKNGIVEINDEKAISVILDLCRIGRKILFVYNNNFPKEIFENLKKQGFSCAVLDYSSCVDDFNRKLTGIKNGFYHAVFVLNEELIKFSNFDILVCFEKPALSLNNVPIVKIQKQIENRNGAFLDTFMKSHIKKYINGKVFNILTYDELEKLLYENNTAVLRSFITKSFICEEMFATGAEFNIQNFSSTMIEYLYENFYMIIKNETIKIRACKSIKNNSFEIFYLLFKSGALISRNFKFMLKKETMSSEDIIYKNLLTIIEMLEFFNSYDEIRVFGKKEFDINDFDYSTEAFFWLFFLHSKELVKINILNKKIEIVFTKKIESIIIAVRNEFKLISKTLDVLKKHFDIDINTFSSVNIFEYCKSFADNNNYEVIIALYLLKYMDIIEMEPVNMYFSPRVKIKAVI